MAEEAKAAKAQADADLAVARRELEQIRRDVAGDVAGDVASKWHHRATAAAARSAAGGGDSSELAELVPDRAAAGSRDRSHETQCSSSTPATRKSFLKGR